MSDEQKKTSNLFEEFPPVSTEQWEDVITQDLRGEEYRKKLTWITTEGINTLPFYRKKDLETVTHVQKKLLPAAPAVWDLCEEVFAADPSAANRAAKKAVENGADSLKFTMRAEKDEGAADGVLSGTEVYYPEDLEILLSGINLEKTGVVFDAGVGSAGMIKTYLESSAGASPNPETKLTPSEEKQSPSVSFLFDPFTFMAEYGRPPQNPEELNSVIGQMASGNGFMTLAADGSFYHNCGATIVQELGISLAIGSEYLARVPAELQEQTSQQFWMHLSAGPLYFPEIAKFRAVRLLWERVLDGFEIENRKPLMIHAVTSLWNKTAADPHNNILRATTEAMAAIVGGAGRITVHPYNNHFEEPDDLSIRVARNISHILENEAYLSKVQNPADGSYYIEMLTDQIARKAWDFFREIEQKGGFQKAVESKFIYNKVIRSAKEKYNALATRKMVLTGVNNYPNAGEKLPAGLNKNTRPELLRQTDHNPEDQHYPALKKFRAAEPFENIRLNTQNFAEKRGKGVIVQLVPAGNKKMRKTRTSFSQNYLQCAGFQVHNTPGYQNLNDAAKKLNSSGADIFVLCSSDEEYPELVPEFCREFKGKGILILAGYPKDHIDEFKKAGIDLFIYSGSNMIDTLKEIQKLAGILK